MRVVKTDPLSSLPVAKPHLKSLPKSPYSAQCVTKFSLFGTLLAEGVEKFHHDSVRWFVSCKGLFVRLQFTMQKCVPHRVDHFNERREELFVSAFEVYVSRFNTIANTGKEIEQWSRIAPLIQSQQLRSLVR